MTEQTRESRLLDAVSFLADTLVADYDVVEVAQTLVETSISVFDVDAAGLLIAGSDGTLDVLASTSEASRLIEVLQLDAQAGPCLECFRTGQPVSVSDITTSPPDWSRFTERALELGYRSVHAVPLRHRTTVVGTLNLFGMGIGALNEADLRAARTLADVTTLGILQDRHRRESAHIQLQLENALSSRVTIEQAKGFIAHRKDISVDEAFALLRAHARTNRIRLVDAAALVVNRDITL